MTGRLSGAQAENIEGEENVKVKMKIQKKGWGGLDDRWRGAKEVIKESKKESMRELKHAASLYFKEQTFTDNKLLHSCLLADIISLKVLAARARAGFKGGLAAAPLFC